MHRQKRSFTAILTKACGMIFNNLSFVIIILMADLVSGLIWLASLYFFLEKYLCAYLVSSGFDFQRIVTPFDLIQEWGFFSLLKFFSQNILAVVFSTVLMFYFSLGTIRIYLDLYDTGSSRSRRLFSTSLSQLTNGLIGFILCLPLSGFSVATICHETIIKTIINLPPGAILAGLIIMLILFYLAIRLSLYPYFIMDKNVNIATAMRGSFQASEKYWAELFIIILLGIILHNNTILSLIFSIFSIPLYVCIYRDALSFSDESNLISDDK